MEEHPYLPPISGGLKTVSGEHGAKSWFRFHMKEDAEASVLGCMEAPGAMAHVNLEGLVPVLNHDVCLCEVLCPV